MAQPTNAFLPVDMLDTGFMDTGFPYTDSLGTMALENYPGSINTYNSSSLNCNFKDTDMSLLSPNSMDSFFLDSNFLPPMPSELICREIDFTDISEQVFREMLAVFPEFHEAQNSTASAMMSSQARGSVHTSVPLFLEEKAEEFSQDVGAHIGNRHHSQANPLGDPFSCSEEDAIRSLSEPFKLNLDGSRSPSTIIERYQYIIPLPSWLLRHYHLGQNLKLLMFVPIELAIGDSPGYTTSIAIIEVPTRDMQTTHAGSKDAGEP
ncbi:hypothetical protein K505DRAFT_364597 [Melanomma pulvis-pyrius CBS 109.77]|uniref:Uncharacterized protein n=1 Tax=Melanomma pulvis-pyrius CBS 109.77 TaxID=1314802 RepID=A0A6A6X2Z5_9PLEO|nr:hypothetical protein K505DRAFT_364597 [Melanomma pulvis-pyrius CBS 109.77]